MNHWLEGKEEELDFHWVIDFPLLGYDDEEGKWNAVHHPFTRPHPDDIALLDDESKWGEIRGAAYDVVLNGNDLGGGSLRIHEGDLQAKMFRVLGIDDEEQYAGSVVYYGATQMEATLCRGRTSVVVGGGNSAGQAAVYLASPLTTAASALTGHVTDPRGGLNP